MHPLFCGVIQRSVETKDLVYVFTVRGSTPAKYAPGLQSWSYPDVCFMVQRLCYFDFLMAGVGKMNFYLFICKV